MAFKLSVWNDQAPDMILRKGSEELARVRLGAVELEGVIDLPEDPRGIVLFAHGSGSSRRSPRNQFVAHSLLEAGLGTFLVDLLTAEEDRNYSKRFEIRFLTERLGRITEWLREKIAGMDLRIGYFGASTGAAAALWAAVNEGGSVAAIVSRGGRPDLAEEILPEVEAPTLLIVGGNDEPVTGLNISAYQRLRARKELVVIPGATHLFEEPGALEEVARLAGDWFLRFLPIPGSGGMRVV
jgi:putative phosphoribosyl transferase